MLVPSNAQQTIFRPILVQENPQFDIGFEKSAVTP